MGRRERERESCIPEIQHRCDLHTGLRYIHPFAGWMSRPLELDSYYSNMWLLFPWEELKKKLGEMTAVYSPLENFRAFLARCHRWVEFSYQGDDNQMIKHTQDIYPEELFYFNWNHPWLDPGNEWILSNWLLNLVLISGVEQPIMHISI